MEKRLVLAVIVSIVFFFLWSWLFNPAMPPQLPECSLSCNGGGGEARCRVERPDHRTCAPKGPWRCLEDVEFKIGRDALSGRVGSPAVGTKR